MKRSIICIVLALLLLVACTNSNVQNNRMRDTYEIAKQLVHELWEVDYTTFTEQNMSEFAKLYFEPGYREDFLANPEENVNIEHVRQTKLISHVKETQNKGGEIVEIEGQAFYAQDLQAEIKIEQFLPEDENAYIYKTGETYTVNYKVFFLEEAEAVYIAGFTYGLPNTEKAPLSEAQREQMISMAKAYIDVRYNLAYETVSTEDLWAFYEQNVEYAFLLQDGITEASIAQMVEEYRAYHVNIVCNDATFAAQSKAVEVEISGQMHNYYVVEVEYTYKIEADDSFFIDKGLSQRETLKEWIYFDIRDEAELYIVFAKYMS